MNVTFASNMRFQILGFTGGATFWGGTSPFIHLVQYHPCWKVEQPRCTTDHNSSIGRTFHGGQR